MTDQTNTMERAREISESLSGYIGAQKRRDELADDIAAALIAARREGMMMAKEACEAQVRLALFPEPTTAKAETRARHYHHCATAIQALIDRERT